MDTLISTGTHAVSWNGPICNTCGARYLGSHVCTREDIMRRVNELLDHLSPAVPTKE